MNVNDWIFIKDSDGTICGKIIDIENIDTICMHVIKEHYNLLEYEKEVEDPTNYYTLWFDLKGVIEKKIYKSHEELFEDNFAEFL